MVITSKESMVLMSKLDTLGVFLAFNTIMCFYLHLYKHCNNNMIRLTKIIKHLVTHYKPSPRSLWMHTQNKTFILFINISIYFSFYNYIFPFYVYIFTWKKHTKIIINTFVSLVDTLLTNGSPISTK